MSDKNFQMKSTYAVGAIGKDLISNFVGMFYLFYLTNAIGLSPMILGIAFFFAKIWDGVNDPMMGAIVDNTRTKFGKFRPWILIGSVINGLVVILMFANIESAMAFKYVFYIFMYVIWSMTYTIMDIPYWAMIPSLANDEKERNTIATIARVFTGIGTLIVAVGTPKFLTTFYSDDSPEGYLAIAIIFATFFVIMMTVTAIFTKEKYNVSGEKVKFKDIFKTISKNDQLRGVLFTATLIFTAMVITSVISPFYFTYVLGNLNLVGLFTMVLGAGYGGSMLLFPILAKKFGRRNIFIYSCIFSMIGYVMLFIASTLASENQILLAIVSLITFSGFGLIAVSITAMLADVVDYGEVLLGNRTDSLVFAMQSFMYKFAAAFATLVTGFGLQVAGLTGKDPETDAAVTLSANGNTVIRIIMFLVPILFLFIGLMFYLKCYKLNGDFKEDIMKRLNVIRENKMKVNND